MAKFVLFDVDGVVLEKRKKGFGARIFEDYGIAPETTASLFKNEFYRCVAGEMDLREVLKNYVDDWGWKGSIDELLRYWWAGEETINQDVIDEISSLRNKGVRCYLASDQEKNRMGYLLGGMGLKKYFDGSFFSCNLGVRKTDPEFWRKVLESLGNPSPKEVLYYDDEAENVEVAQKSGVEAVLFRDINDFSKT